MAEKDFGGVYSGRGLLGHALISVPSKGVKVGFFAVWDNGKPYGPNCISTLFAKFIAEKLWDIAPQALREEFIHILSIKYKKLPEDCRPFKE